MKPLIIFIAAIFASLEVTRAAALSYEVTGQLTDVSFGSQRLVGTPFTVRFSYSPDSLQIADIYGDFPALAVVTSGEFLIDSELLISFTDQLFSHYTDSSTGILSFHLNLDKGTSKNSISTGLTVRRRLWNNIAC